MTAEINKAVERQHAFDAEMVEEICTDIEGSLGRFSERQKTEFVREAFSELSRLREENERLERQVKGYQHHLRACEQIAGKALGYPWFKDDQKNFPGATEADGVCIGDHVGDTIVEELATRFEDVTRERDEAREALEPFAARIVDIGESEDDGDRFNNGLSPFSQSITIKVGDIRRSAALSRQSKEGG